jgi:hypothetical protein
MNKNHNKNGDDDDDGYDVVFCDMILGSMVHKLQDTTR